MSNAATDGVPDGSDGFLPRFLAQASQAPQRPFARCGDEQVSLGWLHRASDAVAAQLHRRGIRPGDRVAVMLRNSAAMLAVFYGLAKARAVWVPVNVQLQREGLRYILEHAEPALVIAERDLWPAIEASAAACPDIVFAGAPEGLAAWLADPTEFAASLPAADDLLAIMYTSGTTGPPKGVMVSHRMLRLAGEAVVRVADLCDGDVMFVWEPLYHIGGAQLLVVPLLRDVRLAMVPRFSASRFWPEVRESRATHIHFLGGILQILLKQPADPLDRDHCVRIAWGGGCPAPIWRPFEARFGVQIRECYGMTEASSITTCNDRGVAGAVGRPVPWFSVALLDPSGRPVGHGGRGEIVVRTSIAGAIFPGYFRNPEASARALRDGALHTGDLGSCDDAGNLIFHGRVTDSVRCRGENVSAWEVEHVAALHPSVEDCAMIGVAAEIGEQDIKLFVKPKPGHRLDPAELSAWLAQRLAPYQMPRYIAVVAAFERTPSQRIMKHLLPSDLAGCWDRRAGGDAGERPKMQETAP